MRPRDAKTYDDVCRLTSDNTSTADFWLIASEGDVLIRAQRLGEDVTQKIDIPRRDFARLIDWYNRDQKVRRKK